MGFTLKRNVEYKPKQIILTETQSEAFLLFKKRSTKALACVTGFGGAKTFLLCLIANWLMEHYPGILLATGSPTFAMMKRTVWRTLKEVTPTANIIGRNNQDMSLAVDYHDGKYPISEIICLSASNSPIDWQGPNLGGGLLDECQRISRAHYRQTFARLRQSVHYGADNVPPWLLKEVEIAETGTVRMPNKLLVCTNPPSGDHWLPDDFRGTKQKKPRKGFRLLQWSSLDNPHTGEEYHQLLLDTYKGDERRAAVGGELGLSFEGQFFDNFNHDYHVLEEGYAKKIRRQSTIRVYGMDHGYVNPFAFVEVVYWKKLEAWVVTRLAYGSRWSIARKAKAIKKIYKSWEEYDFHSYSDHAAQDRAELEREHNIITEPAIKRRKSDKRKGKSSVDDSLQFLRSMFDVNDTTRQSQLFVSAGCVELIHELGSFRSKKSPTTEDFMEYTYEGPNHAIDATRYALYSLLTNHPSMFVGGGSRDEVDFVEKEKYDEDDRLIQERGYYGEDEKDVIGSKEDSYFGV